MIFIDHTEARDGTRLPDGILAAAQVLPGLEAATGADLLLSPLDLPLATLDGTLPARLAFGRHLASGMLVQRKSGLDFTASLGRLADHLHRMQRDCRLPMLVVVADLKVDRDGQCVVNGTASGYTFNAVLGALLWWQLRGGYVAVLPRDAAFIAWVNVALHALRELRTEPVKHVVRMPEQVLAEPNRAVEMLVGARIGLGPEKAQRLLAFCGGSLAWAWAYLTDEASVRDHHLEGIGPTTIRKARELMRLPEGSVLVPVGAAEE